MNIGNFIEPGTTVTLKDGRVLVAREWGAEQEATVMGELGRHKGGCTTALLARALGRGIPETRNYLSHLMERGRVENVGDQSTRALWQRLDTTVDPRLVVEAHKPKIRQHLIGRAEMPGRIAAELHLEKDEVVETCKAMMLAGELSGTRIGAAFVYRLDQRHQERRVEPEQLAREIRKSPETLFQGFWQLNFDEVKLPVAQPEFQAARRSVSCHSRVAEVWFTRL